MQKISSYLYPNRINVVADVAVFPVRYKIVYQNRIKIYQGVDNVLTIDIKNSDQKRIDLDGLLGVDESLKMSIQDVLGKEFLVADVTPSATKGLATVSIQKTDLDDLDPQFLNFTIYKINADDSKTVFYADTQFGVKGNMELMGNALNTPTAPRYITRFAPITVTDPQPNITTYYSDAVEIRQPNYLDVATNDSVDLDFIFKGLDATITVEYTDEVVIGANIPWTTLETFAVTTATTSVTKTYENPEYNRDANWLRVRYIRTTNNTGSIDKVVIRL
jgi:hypothetical protein